MRFAAADKLHLTLSLAIGTALQQRVVRRAPVSKPRQYEFTVTLTAGNYQIAANTDGGLQFALTFTVTAEPMTREVQVPLVGR
ncbi:MAG: hypothetical protein ABIP94_11160 [Planctomycetota bacterium]